MKKQRGVSLLEVLISIVVIAIGVLGLSKMQALAISNTQISGSRGLIALQASSLAAMMHANQVFWQISAAPACAGAAACTLSGPSLAANTTATSFTTPPALSTCTFLAPCTAAQIASLDINGWMANMYSLVPTYTLNINCSTTGAAGSLNTCAVQIVWIEKQQGMNQTTAALAAATPAQTQQYFLYVQP